VGGSNNLFWDNTNGRLGIGITTPTNTLDVNGTVRIRQISNAVGNFLTKSATGVIQERTAAEARVDLGVVLSVVAGTGIEISGTAVNPSVFLTGQALSFATLSGDGFVYRTSGVVGVRTITAGAGITVTNGDGVAGNPTIINGSGFRRFYTFPIVGTTGATINTTAGGSFDVKTPSGSTIFLLPSRSSAKMEIRGRLKTRNAINLIQSIAIGLGGATTFDLTLTGINFNSIQDFKITVTSSPTTTDGYFTNYTELEFYDYVNLKWISFIFESMLSGGYANIGSFWNIRDIGITVTFVEANSANELQIHSAFAYFGDLYTA
jgi:hypothetical protein